MHYIPVYEVQLVRDSSVKSDYNTIRRPEDAYNILTTYLAGTDREHVVILLLNTKNKLIGINTVSIGSLSASIIHPRELFKTAILANAGSIIVAHNHPSGDPAPSQEDMAVNRRLVDAGNLLGITVRDHVIVCDDSFFSFKEKGLMPA